MKPVSAHLPPMTRRSERGVALVITLILLSVTLVMAVAFLAMSRREREANATNTDITQARLAAESALAAAQAQILANIYSTTNAGAYNYGLLVSTNYVTTNVKYQSQIDGFNTGLGYSTNSNVNYFDINGNLLSGANLAQNIANLQILPRAPVFVPNGNGGLDFRYYLDLNRNGMFDTNGWIVAHDKQGNSLGDYFEVGDPEWVGVLEHPDQLHSPVNKFVSRYAFLAQPIGNSLDINAIHNQARSQTLSLSNDGYTRDQGVGSWELNLAAFFVDVSPDIWGPNPLPDPGFYEYNNNRNYGVAFNDALSILSYRYNYNYTSLLSLINNFSSSGNYLFTNVIDEYSDYNFGVSLSQPWLGSDNINHFYSLPDELFNTNETSSAFLTRIQNAGTSTDTYDRNTFYRLLTQLGTDSSAEVGKLNLNYKNVNTNGAVVPGMETNLIPWTNALDFFTNAADRMLRMYTTNWYSRNPSNFLASYYGLVVTNSLNPDGYGLTNFPYYGITNQVPGFGIGNIPVYANGRLIYSTAINRILQLAANIYDAMTNAPYPAPAFFPSVFRPLLFQQINPPSYGNYVYIGGYQQVFSYVTNASAPPDNPPVDLAFAMSQNTTALTNYNVYGVPWIVGAKKYMPNFNQISMVNQVQVTRKLQYTRTLSSSGSFLGSATTYTTNQLYAIAVSNNVVANFWNSYQGSYPGTASIFGQDTVKEYLTTANGTTWGSTNYLSIGAPMPNWAGSGWNLLAPMSAQTPSPYSFTNFGGTFGAIQTVYQPLNFWPYEQSAAPYNLTNVFDPAPIAQLPTLQLTTSNWFYSVIVDSSQGNRILDYVQLSGPTDSTNISTALSDVYPSPSLGPQNADGYIWATNMNNGIIYGLAQQGAISAGTVAIPNQAFWQPTANFPQTGQISDQQAYFNAFFTGNTAVNSELSIQAPYTPTRTLFCPYLMQVNDPLVHYLATDLAGVPGDTVQWGNQATYPNGYWVQDDNTVTKPVPQPLTATLGQRYQPWGLMKQMASVGGGVSANAYDLTIKDPGVSGSDFWNFPTNLFPTVGWLGRVHRGSPWQTVYLKSADVLAETLAAGQQTTVAPGLATWQAWSGDPDAFDATNVVPVQDRLLFDVFTTSLNDNSTRGTLSVNQNNLAAWSALFGGMVALTNTTTLAAMYTNGITTAPYVINPAGVAAPESALWQIYTNINATRASFPNGVFTHLGDILATPALTLNSPFLNTTGTYETNRGVNDELYEWLPQQAMSLLRVSDAPRYVIYGYGQALRPAPNGYYTASGGNLFDLVTNYQVMAETGLRAVIQVHPHVTATSSGSYVTNFTTTVESYDILPPH